MTLDVCIGKKIEYMDEEGLIQSTVRECPKAYHDVCNPEYSFWPRESYRSGSTGFWNFFEHHVGDLYHRIRQYPNSNDFEMVKIKPILDEINQLPSTQFKNGIKVIDEYDWDRMKWLKFWSNRAVKIYGDNAYISFS